MASRDLSTFRTVTSQAVKAPDTTLNVLADFGAEIARQNQEAKINENLAGAQLDLTALQAEYQTKFQSDPTGGMKEYKQARKDLLSGYGEDISPLFKRQWTNLSAEIEGKNDIHQQAWAIEQTRKNTVTSVNNSIKTTMQQAYIDGQKFGDNPDTAVETFSNYDTQINQYKRYAEQNLGAENAAVLFDDIEEDVMKMRISGVMENNPLMALNLMDQDEVKNSFSDQKQYGEMKQSIKNKAKNFQSIAVQNEVLTKLSTNIDLINRPADAPPISYADAQKLKGDMSAPAQSYLDKIMGYKTGGGASKLSQLDKNKENVELFRKFTRLTEDKDITADDLSSFQDALFTASNNKSITGKEFKNYNNFYLEPLMDQMGDNLSEYDIKDVGIFGGGKPWIREDAGLGFKRIDSFLEEVLVQPFEDEDLSNDQEGINISRTIDMYKYYGDALERESAANGFRVGDIPNQSRDQQRKIYDNAFLKAKTSYLQGRFSGLKNMEDNMPDVIIDSSGSKIKTGLGNGNSSGTVSVKAGRKFMEDSNGNKAWVYDDGTIEEIK